MLQNVMKNKKCMKNFIPISAPIGPSKILSKNISFLYVTQIDIDVIYGKTIF